MRHSDPERPSVRRWAELALLVVAGLWGATFVMVKDALADVGPMTFVAFRFVLATAAMLPFLWLGPQGSRSWRSGPESTASTGLLWAGLVVGACLFAGYAFQTAGLQFTGAGRAGFITGLSVVIVPVLGAVLERNRIGRSVLVGVGCAIAGLALLSLGDPESRHFELNLGDALVFGCAWGFGLHILAVGRLARAHSAVWLAFAQILVVAVFSSMAAMLWEQPSGAGLMAVWPAAAFTGLLCTVVGFTVQTRAQAFTSPTHTALIFSTEPVFALLFAALLIGERLGTPELLGCGLILGGMLLAQLEGPTGVPPRRQGAVADGLGNKSTPR